MCWLREFVETSCCLVLVLVLHRGGVFVQGQDGCCSEEVVGSVCRKPLEVVAVDGARVFGKGGLVDVLSSDCWNLS